jgi:serine/threonine protein kinase
MGTVHVAVDTFIERAVAIKSLRAELTRDPDFVSRFRAEATSLARMNCYLARPPSPAPLNMTSFRRRSTPFHLRSFRGQLVSSQNSNPRL